MDWFFSIVQIVFALCVIIFVIWLSYRASRMTSKLGSSYRNANMQVIERVALGQDKGMAIVKVCGKYYLVGIASQSVDILEEIEYDTIKSPTITEIPNFKNILKNIIKPVNGDKNEKE